MSNNPHPFKTNISITTATFDGDSNIPDTAYGDEVSVNIVSHDQVDPHSVTVSIGNKMFPVSQIEFILEAVKRHQAAVKAWNTTKA